MLFEGDVRRYRIPFESVTGCEVAEIRMDSDEWGTDLYYATVLSFETENGQRDLPFAGRHLEFKVRRMPQRQEQAEELCAAVLAALQS